MESIGLCLYDFDGTLYDGDSLIDFWRFTLRHRPSAIFLLPYQLVSVLLWKAGVIPAGRAKEAFLASLSLIPENQLGCWVERFWIEHGRRRIFDWVTSALERDKGKGNLRICISASPEFLLVPMLSSLGFDHWIGTQIEYRSGRPVRLRGRNCKGQEKARRLEEWQERQPFASSIHSIVSDSPVDLEVFCVARTKYRVIRGKRLEMGRNS